MEEKDYTEKIKAYQNYLKGRIKVYSGISNAEDKVNLLESCLIRLQDAFPEIK